MIASSMTVDVYRIEAAEPYPASYQATVKRNEEEQLFDELIAVNDRDGWRRERPHAHRSSPLATPCPTFS